MQDTENYPLCRSCKAIPSEAQFSRKLNASWWFFFNLQYFRARILQVTVRCILSVILMLTILFYSGYSNSERCWRKQPNCPSGEGSLFSTHVWTQYRISGCPCNDSAARIHEILQRWYLYHVIESCVHQKRCKQWSCRIPYSFFLTADLAHTCTETNVLYIWIFLSTILK